MPTLVTTQVKVDTLPSVGGGGAGDGGSGGGGPPPVGPSLNFSIASNSMYIPLVML